MDVRNSSKNIITLILLVFITLLFDLKNSYANGKNLTLKIVERSTMNYKKALDDYNKQLEYCENKAFQEKLKRSLFSNIKLTQKQLEIALYWYYKKALASCESEKYGLFLIQRGLYSEVLKQYTLSVDDEPPPFYDDYSLFGGKYKDVEFELKYLNLPKKERNKLDKIPELKMLFRFNFILEDKPK